MWRRRPDLRGGLDPGHLRHHRDPFLVFTSNVLPCSVAVALLALPDARMFRYLKPALALSCVVASRC